MRSRIKAHRSFFIALLIAMLYLPFADGAALADSCSVAIDNYNNRRRENYEYDKQLLEASRKAYAREDDEDRLIKSGKLSCDEMIFTIAATKGVIELLVTAQKICGRRFRPAWPQKTEETYVREATKTKIEICDKAAARIAQCELDAACRDRWHKFQSTVSAPLR